MTSAYGYLIIGGGIAGVTAAETIREADSQGTIGIVSSETHLLYSRVLLPSYLKKRISREQVFLRTSNDFARRRIDLLLGRAAVRIDTPRHQVALDTGELIGYEKLLISAGGKVNPWKEAKGLDRVYRLQTLDDADRLYGALGSIHKPLVVGSSFIALEFIEIFVLNGTPPRVLSREPSFFSKMLDEAGARILEENFSRHGVHFLPCDAVQAVEAVGTELCVSGERCGVVESDALAAGIGIRRNLDFLPDSGIAIGRRGIRTDEFLETNSPGVFAAGDMAEYYDVISQTHRLVGNWTNAVLQGKRAGQNMAGERAPFENVPSYAITNLGMQLTALGECDNQLLTISRADPDVRQYSHFFMRDGVIAGAFMINRPGDKPHLASLIAQRIDVSRWADSLHDMAFDIRSIPAVQ